MSIDLGCEWFKVSGLFFLSPFLCAYTSNNISMQVGVVSPGVPMEIALNKESQRKTPSAIAFRDGDRIYGEDALNIGLRFPGNSFTYILDLLGKTVDHPVVDLYKYVAMIYDCIVQFFDFLLFIF